MLKQQIIILMNAPGLRVLDGNDARIRLLGFDTLENQIERFAWHQFDSIAEEPARRNFAVSPPFALKGDTGRVSFGHVFGLKGPLTTPGQCPRCNCLGTGETDRVRGRGSCIAGEKFKINAKAERKSKTIRLGLGPFT